MEWSREAFKKGLVTESQLEANQYGLQHDGE